MSEEKKTDAEVQESEEIIENEAEQVENDSTEEETTVEPEVSEVDALKAEVAALNDKYARVHADFDNIKKRLEREKYQSLEYAQEKLAKDLVPVIDSLEMAVKSTQSDLVKEELFEKLKEGVELTMKQMLTTLEKHGITQVSEDTPFDPQIHHAVQQMDSDEVESGQIVSTFQKGYKYKDRTLRDAMVVVAN